MVTISTEIKTIPGKTRSKNKMINKYYEALDELRDSGYDYMRGEYYLIQTFDIDAEEAKEIYLKWLDTFEDESNEMGFARGYWI